MFFQWVLNSFLYFTRYTYQIFFLKKTKLIKTSIILCVTLCIFNISINSALLGFTRYNRHIFRSKKKPKCLNVFHGASYQTFKSVEPSQRYKVTNRHIYTFPHSSYFYDTFPTLLTPVKKYNWQNNLNNHIKFPEKSTHNKFTH